MSAGERLCARIPALLRAGRVPGLSVALVEGGQVSWARGFGVKSTETGAPVTTQTIFEAASFTKPLFAYLVFLAVDRHLLELDRPLIECLDTETIERDVIGHRLDAEGFRDDWFEQITARHVLSHSSGMPHVERRVPFPLFFEPGESFRYSASGYRFLQLVIEKLTGEPLERFAEDELFRPMAMERSSLVWLERFGADAAEGHDVLGKPQGMRKYRRAHAAASMYTTASDYARFVTAVLGGDGLTEPAQAALRTPQITTRDGDAWALGFGIHRDGDDDALWQWGDYGIFRNLVVAYPSRERAMVYLSNSSNGLGIRDEIVRAVFGPKASTSSSLARYPDYDAPAVRFAWMVIEEGVRTALRNLPQLRRSGEFLDGDVLGELGRLLLEDGRIEDAIAVLELDVEENPCSAAARDRLARARIRRGASG